MEDSKFPDNMKIGPSTEVMGMAAGGDAGDWINKELGIPAAEAELGLWSEYQFNWFPKTEETAFRTVSENLDWVENTFKKLGNQLKIEPVGYKKLVN